MKDFLYNYLFPTIGYIYLWFVGKTSRWKIIRQCPQITLGGKPCIYAFWHGRLSLLYYPYRQKKIMVMSSTSEDGRISIGILSRFGFSIVYGSRRSGAISSLLKMVRMLKDGYQIALTPDAPPGPYFKVQPGVVFLAKKTNVPIIPVTFAAKRKKVLNTKDKFIFPFPFNRVVIIEDEPIIIDDSLSIENAQKLIEEKLNQITIRAEQMVK